MNATRRNCGSRYHVTFWRYRDHQGELSHRWLITAETFAEAHAICQDMIFGMKNVDPDSDYEVASIECVSYINARQAVGPYIWQMGEDS